MTFESLLRLYRFYEALALYDAYYERMANLGEGHSDLGDSLPIAWVPLVFHCTYLENLAGILKDREIRPGKGKGYVSLTELSITELTRFRSLRTKPFEIAIGFPRAQLESQGLFQPAYLKHASQDTKNAFKDAPRGYVDLEDDLGALHEVRIPGPLSIDDAVWVLSSKRNEQSKDFDLPELKPLRDAKITLSYWHPSHQEGLIREPVFLKAERDAAGHVVSVGCLGKHYLPGWNNFVEKEIRPPTGKPFNLRFPKEMRKDTLADGWEGPFSKFEMAEFFYHELEKQFSNRISEIRPRIRMGAYQKPAAKDDNSTEKIS